MHEKFKVFLTSTWEEDVDTPKALCKLQGGLLQWNKNVF